MAEPEKLHQDLVGWGVLEPEPPIRFTKRFQGALARAAASLQAAPGVTGDPIRNQVEVALLSFLGEKGRECGPGHRSFVHAVHVATLPEAVRRLLGV